MLLCKQIRCRWHLVYIIFPSDHEAARWPPSRKGKPMSRTASIPFAPSSTPFGRLFATIDRLLLAYAEMTIRNGDTPALQRLTFRCKAARIERARFGTCMAPIFGAIFLRCRSDRLRRRMRMAISCLRRNAHARRAKRTCRCPFPVPQCLPPGSGVVRPSCFTISTTGTVVLAPHNADCQGRSGALPAPHNHTCGKFDLAHWNIIYQNFDNAAPTTFCVSSKKRAFGGNNDR